MKLKDLEHDGNEDFNSFTGRKEVKKIKEVKKKQDEEKEFEQRKKDQEEWLSPANDLLWDEID